MAAGIDAAREIFNSMDADLQNGQRYCAALKNWNEELRYVVSGWRKKSTGQIGFRKNSVAGANQLFLGLAFRFIVH